MNDAVAFLSVPFATALCLVAIHTYFGIEVLQRKVVFVDLALAQLAALGATVAFMAGYTIPSVASYGYSFAFTLAAAALFAFLRSPASRIPHEALIGIVYVVAAAASILLIDRAPQGAEHLKQILTGNIVTTGWPELSLIALVYAIVGALHATMRRHFAASGDRTWLGDFFFYATFGAVVTSSVAVAGVLLVFSLLIMPAAVGVLYADRLLLQLAIGWVLGALASALGLALSFVLDLPSGASMVCTLGATFGAALLLHPFLRGDRRHAATRLLLGLRVALAAVFGLSGAALIAVPRADQPVLDAVESFAPQVRELYLNRGEAAVYRDANDSAERYRAETERLNALEVSTRSGERTLDDSEVRRVSSFLKSYQEMRRGEEFVKREVRSRARERTRWLTGGTALCIGLLLWPGAAASARRLLASIKRR